jgi:hypothetical protein
MKKFSHVVLAVAMSVLFLMPAHAKAASNSLGVNPRRDYTIKAGEKIQDILNVTNLHKTEDLTVSIKVVDFKAADQTGTPNLLLKQTEPTRWSLKPYLTIASSYKIPAGKSADVPFTINIPSNVGAGSFYSAIHYSVTGGDENAAGSNLSLAGSSVSLLFVRVPGEARSSLLLKEFGAFYPTEDMITGSYATFFSAAKPKYLSYTLENKGNLAEEPTGSMQLKDMFGKEVQLYEKANPNDSLVLIDQTRRIDVCLNEVDVTEKNKLNGQDEKVKQCHDPRLMPGRYTANLIMLYGGEGTSSNEIKAVSSFWYIPAWFIIAVAAVLLIVFFIARSLIRKLSDKGKKTYSRR